MALVETIGADGYALLEVIYSTPELNWLAHVPAVETLRRVWVQQFEIIEGRPHFRANDNIPPPPQMICSPYDTEATYGRKVTTWWVGYKVHLTESCDEDSPRLITHVETSRAGNGDVDVTPVIHQAQTGKRAAAQRAPDRHQLCGGKTICPESSTIWDRSNCTHSG
jgi:transposase